MATKQASTALEVFTAMMKEADSTFDPDEARLQILSNIWDAKSVAQVLEEGSTTSVEDNPDILNRAIRIMSFEPRKGDFGVYLLIQAVDIATGEIINPPLATGGEVVLTQLAKLYQLGAIPAEVRFIQKETSRGTNVLRLIPAFVDEAYEEGEAEEVTIASNDVETVQS